MKHMPPVHHDDALGLDVYHVERKTVLSESPEFQRKGLGTHTAEVGWKCDIDCGYCSSASTYRQQEVFTKIGRTSFETGYAVIDPTAPDRLSREIRRLGPEDTVILCSKTDGWSPLARQSKIGKRMLRMLLTQSKASVRIISKSSYLNEEFELIEQFQDRVMLGLSITGLPEHDAVVQTYERNACPPSKRIATMAEAARRGLRVFGMLCPLFPGLFSTREKVRELLDTAAGWGVEAIWTEIPNPRGRAIQNCTARLQAAGHDRYALAFNALRDEKARSQFGLWLTTTVQQECRALGLIDRLHVLNYESSFTDDVRGIISRDPEGVIWL